MKTLSTHAAKAIRTELKATFPGQKFSVKSDSFSMGNAVRVRWTDSPTSEEVSNIIDKYQYGHFDGMQDMYEMSNCREDIPQVKFVSTYREMSDEVQAELLQVVADHWGIEDLDYQRFYQQFNEYASTMVYREYVKKSYYQKPEVTKPIDKPAQKIASDDITIEDYSEKAIVFGVHKNDIKKIIVNPEKTSKWANDFYNKVSTAFDKIVSKIYDGGFLCHE